MRDEEDSTLPGLPFNRRQLFWLAYGNAWCKKVSTEALEQSIETDRHSPSQWRVRGTVMNSEEFARDFECPVGSPMNPEQKCSLW